LPVCRLCNARLDRALTVSVGRVVRVVCPNCKSTEIFDDFPTPEEQKEVYRKIVERIKDEY
jgi:phage FluMu protein Com